MTVELANIQSAAMNYPVERTDLAVAFQSTARLNLHEVVASHFSLAVNESGRQFPMNPNQRHFATSCASDLPLPDADVAYVMDRPGAPDPTVWGLHSMVHSLVPHARCVMHAHPVFSTVLASLADSCLPAIDQNTAIFFDNRVYNHA